MGLNLTSAEINSIFPVIGISAFPGGVIVRRQNLNQKLARIHTIKRGKITMVSKRSLNKLALLVRSSGIEWRSVMTLTYGLNYPNSGRVVKRHLNAFLVAAKREFGPFSYFWVVEFQSRGAPHLHMATTLDPPDYLQRSRFAHIWTRLAFPDWSYQELFKTDWGSFEPGEVVNCRVLGYHVHSHISAWERVRGTDGMSRYMAKYANKLRQNKCLSRFKTLAVFGEIRVMLNFLKVKSFLAQIQKFGKFWHGVGVMFLPGLFCRKSF